MNYETLINPILRGLRPSGIRKFFDIANEMEDVITLSIGEPDFSTPWHIRQEGIRSLEKGKTWYTANAGLLRLREAIAGYTMRHIGVAYEPKTEVLVTVGGSEAIDLCLRALVCPGDEVLIPQPSFVCYEPLTVMAGGTAVPIVTKAEDGFRLTAEALRAALTPKTKLLILPYPNNPTGAVYSREQLKAWVEYALEQNAVILFDAAYEAFIRDEALPRSIYEIEGAERCAIEFCSFSKTAGFTGTRCGWTVVPLSLETEGMSLNHMWLRRQTTKFNGVPYIVQRGAAAVFTPEGQRQTAEGIAYYRENAHLIADALTGLGIWYTGGVNSPYVWLACPDGMDSWTFFDRLLEKAQVVGTPGAGFGRNGEGYFRLTAFGDRDRTRQAVERLRRLSLSGR